MSKRWLRQWGSIVVAMLLTTSVIVGDITPVYGALSDDSFEEDNSYLDDTYSSTDRDDMLAVNTDDDPILNDTTNDELSENVDLTEEDKVTADDVIFEAETVSENVSDVDGDNEGFEISPDGGNVNSDSYKSPTNPYSNKGYTGQCTWYAWGRAREKLGISLPFTGDAKNWRAMAEASGFQTGDSPRSNSIMVMRPNCSCKGASYGHVVFIESVHGSTMTVSEGNSSKVANGVEYDVPVMNTGGTNTGYWNCPDEYYLYGVLNPYIVSGFIYLGNTNHTPRGHVDELKAVDGGIYLRGWAIDDDNHAACLSIHVYIGDYAHEGHKAEVQVIKASRYRSDGGIGDHGFEETIKTSRSGNLPIYIYAIDCNVNDNPCLNWNNGKGTVVSVNHKPRGAVDSLKGGTGTVYVRGWAIDDDDHTACLNIHVYIGDYAHEGHKAEVKVIKASRYRSDNKIGDHGFEETITTSKSGSVPIYVYALDAKVNDNPCLNWNNGKGTTVNITKKVSVTGVSLNKSNTTLTVGKSETLTATVSPSNATDKSIKWTTSNANVATVGTGGVVTAKAVGTATITVQTADGNKTATCKVTVNPATVAVTGVSLNKQNANILVGKTETLTATVSPSNATNKSVTWSSDNTNIATVSSTGVVTAKKEGTATIKVQTVDGNKTATCKVTVVTTPVITTTILPDGEVGKSYSAKLIASGTIPVTWSKTAGSLPDGLTLSSDGTISGTPTVASRFIVTVQAKNSYGNSPTKQLTINIAGIAPIITYDSRTAVQGGGPIKPSEIGKPYSFTFTAEGTAPLKWSIVSGALPAGLSLNSQTGEISGIATQLGSKDFRIRVENLYGSAEESYYINIYTNVPNIVTESFPDGVVGEEYFVNIDTTNYDVDGDISKLYVSEGLQLNEWLDNPEIITGWGHKITGVPKKAGTFIFTLTVENSYGKSSKKFTVNIKSPKTEPNPGNDTIKGKDSTIVAGQRINLSEICFAGIETPISRYLVNDKKVASVSKTMLSGKTAGTVKVTAQASVGKNKYEDVAICTVTVLNRPKLKFTLPMTYESQIINASDYFITTDTNILGATYWESSNPAVVEVTNASKGTLKAHNEGNVNISAYFGEKGKNGTLKVTTSLKMKKPAFQKSSYKLQTGAKMTLAMKNVTAALNPVWHAEDNRIINVYPQIDKKGNKTGKVIVEGLSYGDTRLIANINGQKYVCNVSVTAPKINKAKLTIKVTKSATVSLSGTKIKKSEVKWYSSNSNVAVVDANGKIWAISKGEAIIYTETGGFRNECVVTVK